MLRDPKLIAETLRKALARLKPQAEAARSARDEFAHRIEMVSRDLDRLTSAIRAGGELQTLVAAMKAKEQEREGLQRQLAALDRVSKAADVDFGMVEREIRGRMEQWRTLLRKHVPQARQVLKRLLAGGVFQFTAHRQGRSRWYEFRAAIPVGRLLAGLYRFEGTADFSRLFSGVAGLAVATMVASPTGFEPVFWP